MPPKFAKVNRCEEDEVRNSCSIAARGCGEVDLNCSDCSASLPPCRINNCCEIVPICEFWIFVRLYAELACECEDCGFMIEIASATLEENSELSRQCD